MPITISLQKNPANTPCLIAQMREAASEAIEAAQQYKTWHTARQGQQLADRPGGFSYTFLLEDDWEPLPNTCVQIAVDPSHAERTVSATILSVLNAHITLVTAVPLPRTSLAQISFFDAPAWS